MMQPITSGQLKKLQTLWGIAWKAGTQPLYVGADTDGSVPPPDPERLSRICWLRIVSRRDGLESSRQLTKSEAEMAIGELAKCVPAHLNYKKRRPRRAQAQELGTAGRRSKAGPPFAEGAQGEPERLAGSEEWKHIEALMAQLGWDRERLDGFLRSMHSPLRKAGRSEIRTLADANRVRWALKRILKRGQTAR